MSGAEAIKIQEEIKTVAAGAEVSEVLIVNAGGEREDLFTLREGYVKPDAELRANDTTIFTATMPEDRNAEVRPAPEVVVAVKGIGKLAELSIFATPEAQEDPRIIKGVVACAMSASGTTTAKLAPEQAVDIEPSVLEDSGFTEENDGLYHFDRKEGMAVPINEDETPKQGLRLVANTGNHEAQLAA